MKICPQCERRFADEMNYCLEDGVTLVDFHSHDPSETLSYSKDPTLQYFNQGATKENKEAGTQNRTDFGQSSQKRKRPNIFLMMLGVFGIIGLIVASVVGGFLYLKSKYRSQEWTPTPTPFLRNTPVNTPIPKTENNIKVEILEKVDGSFGQKFLKCKITNTSENIVLTPNITLFFYQKDVKIKDAGGGSKLKLLKPNQSVPVWINIYGVDKYTSIKVEEPLTARTINQSETQIFPEINITETVMKGEKEGLSYNFRNYTKIYWKVKGIIETETPQKNSIKLYVLYKDENSEIVGIGETRISDLKVGEKTKFEVSECEIDLFGTPKTFEIIAVNDSIN
jgi:hypothetical protein